MEEYIVSGYCFQLDQARIVEAEFQGQELLSADCSFETCIHRRKCEIGRRLQELCGGSDKG